VVKAVFNAVNYLYDGGWPIFALWQRWGPMTSIVPCCFAAPCQAEPVPTRRKRYYGAGRLHFTHHGLLSAAAVAGPMA